MNILVFFLGGQVSSSNYLTPEYKSVFQITCDWSQSSDEQLL